jgi:hypothetical protein
MSWIYHHDWMFATRWPLPVFLYSFVCGPLSLWRLEAYFPFPWWLLQWLLVEGEGKKAVFKNIVWGWRYSKKSTIVLQNSFTLIYANCDKLIRIPHSNRKYGRWKGDFSAQKPTFSALKSRFFGAHHRVGRVLSFFSSRRNWDSPNPSPQASMTPPRYWGRGTFVGERGVGRVPIPTKGHTLWYSSNIGTLWRTYMS